MKYPTVLRYSSELQERTSVRSAGGSGSVNQNHSTSLARAISYQAEVERLSLLMPPRLARSSILCFTALLLALNQLHLSFSPSFFLSLLLLSISPFSHLLHFIFFFSYWLRIGEVCDRPLYTTLEK